jgi:hypothetical protein
MHGEVMADVIFLSLGLLAFAGFAAYAAVCARV